jgi:hypothetical protein
MLSKIFCNTILALNTIKLRFSFSTFLLLFYGAVYGQVYVFELEKLAALDPVHLSLKKAGKSGTTYLEYEPDGTKNYFNLWSKAEEFQWNNFEYLVFEVEHNEPHSLIMNFDFYKMGKDKASINSKIGIMPKLRTNVIYPLSYLSNESIFLPLYPRQLKGIVLGEKIEKNEIMKVNIDISPYQDPDFRPKLKIYRVYLTKSLPVPLSAPSTVVVDELGQWTGRNWSGKTKDKKELVKNLTKMSQSVKPLPPSKVLSQYGGFKKIQFEATGNFRTHNDGKRWWLVDPDGYAFISTGVDCISPFAAGPVEGMEDLFAPLEKELLDVKDAFIVSRGKKTVNWTVLNYYRAFGKEWRNEWEKIAAYEVKRWGFNTIANWSNEDLARNSGIPYVIQMEQYPTTKIKLYRDFPDVFDPEYLIAAKAFAQQLEKYKNDKYLIGYFLANEPQWAFGATNLAAEIISGNQQSHTRTALVQWLRNKYTSVYALNDAWGSAYGNIDELLSKPQKDLSNKALEDLNQFSVQMVKQYLEPVCTEVKKILPKHLNLGLRYAYISSDLCYVAGSFFDVFSLNGYMTWPPPNTEEITARTGRPVIIGEFHFGSTDRGLPSTGLLGAQNVNDRAKYIRRYVEHAVARKEVVGVHYFQWYDQPVMGRFDGENYSIGLYDITGNPCLPVLKQYKNANDLLYKISSGGRKPYNPQLKPYPTIAF